VKRKEKKRKEKKRKEKKRKEKKRKAKRTAEAKGGVTMSTLHRAAVHCVA
jgi:hypothetical protein